MRVCVFVVCVREWIIIGEMHTMCVGFRKHTHTHTIALPGHMAAHGVANVVYGQI